jgi:UDP-N-acetylmuramate--alanine ligase
MRHIHFVGIGGIGMSGIAKVMLEMGYKVSGSDLKASHMTKKLELLGARCFIGHDGQNIGDADALVVSSAIPEKNPELVEARRRNIRVLQRAEMLGYLMGSKIGIAVAGTHGKTTTTSMIAKVLEYNGLNPTVVIGGELNDIGSNAKLGRDSYLLAEADESDASFLNLTPRIAVITNIDSDVNLNVMPYSRCNYDYDATMKTIVENFIEFIDKVPDDGLVVLCRDNASIREILPGIKKRCITYGLDEEADLRAENISLESFGSTCTVKFRGETLGRLELRVPGCHNILNALASFAVAMELGFSFKGMRDSLSDYLGVQRRFQILGEVNGVMVVDDYAHNPSKIRAALHGARTGGRKRIVAVFQPHRYSRTRFLFKEFLEAFEDADVVIVTDIYAAGEQPIVGVRAERIVEDLRQRWPEKHFIHVPRIEEVITYLHQSTRSGDLVITLGAGDICKAAEKFYYQIKKSELNFAATG